MRCFAMELLRVLVTAWILLSSLGTAGFLVREIEDVNQPICALIGVMCGYFGWVSSRWFWHSTESITSRRDEDNSDLPWMP